MDRPNDAPVVWRVVVAVALIILLLLSCGGVFRVGAPSVLGAPVPFNRSLVGSWVIQIDDSDCCCYSVRLLSNGTLLRHQFKDNWEKGTWQLSAGVLTIRWPMGRVDRCVRVSDFRWEGRGELYYPANYCYSERPSSLTFHPAGWTYPRLK